MTTQTEHFDGRVRETAAPLQDAPRGAERFVVISPCKDEQEHLEASIASVVAQSRRPDLWIIVDDGSTDSTPEILERAARAHSFIRPHRRTNRTGRAVGGGVVEAFNEGLALVDLDRFDFVCKLDSDLELPPRYFEGVLDRMRVDPELGNFSGKVYLKLSDGSTVYERMGDENAIGAAKFYRTVCFRDIDGFVPRAGWDGIDGHMARLKGWKTGSVDEPDLRLIHRRLMGSSEKSIWFGRKRWGRLKWFMGSSPLYVLGVAAYRCRERPYILGSLGILTGYLTAALRREPRYEAPGFRDELRTFEKDALFRGRGAAIKNAMARASDRRKACGAINTTHPISENT